MSLCVNVQVCAETPCSLLGGSQMRPCDYSLTSVISPLRLPPLNSTYPQPLLHPVFHSIQPIPAKSNLLWFQIRPRFPVLSPLQTKWLLLLLVQFESPPFFCPTSSPQVQSFSDAQWAVQSVAVHNWKVFLNNTEMFFCRYCGEHHCQFVPDWSLVLMQILLHSVCGAVFSCGRLCNWVWYSCNLMLLVNFYYVWANVSIFLGHLK